MNYQTARTMLGAATVLAFGLSASTTMAAEGEKPKANPFAAESGLIRVDAEEVPAGIKVRVPVAYSGAVAGWGAYNRDGGPIVASASDSIHKSAEAVRDAKDEEAKKAAQKLLDERLSKYFDEDMIQRESELAKIEERLTKLRELLERRRAKKQEIIDLQAKVALNEADGLGFYNTERHGKGSAFGAAFNQPYPAPAVPVVPPIKVRTAVPETAPTPPTPPTEPTPLR